ncbi:MAG: hypothetical protein FJ405_08680, partial [Verrucomicrobia bacterium]|nr:hypothetical protein [Verrucomicrobiota bacterium]
MGLPHDSSLNFAKAGWRTLTFLSVILLWTGCATRPDHASSAAAPNTPTGRYVRVVHETNGVLALEIAARQFRSQDRRKPALWLVGAVHVADPEYYDRLQELLDRMTLVLFEGVRSRDAGAAREVENRSEASAGSLQASLAEALGISFQLDKIDYSRAHFRNSDLSVAELTEWLSQESREMGGPTGEAKEPSGKAELDLLMSAMDGGSWVSTVAKWGLGLIASSPKLRATTLAVLIETAGAYADSMEDIAGLTPGMRRLLDVLLS